MRSWYIILLDLDCKVWRGCEVYGTRCTSANDSICIFATLYIEFLENI